MRILVGKKHPLARTSRGARALGPTLRAEFAPEELLLHKALANEIPVVVLDIQSQTSDNSSPPDLSSSAGKLRTLVLCLHPEPRGPQAIVATACAFFLEASAAEDVTQVITAAHPQVCARATVPRARGLAAATTASRDALSAREKLILALLAQEKTSKEIAGVLGLSARTVDAHRSALMKRIGVQSSVGLACYAVSAGLVGP